MAEALNPHICAVCNSPDVVAGYTLPLCKPCREIAIRRPVPIALRGVILIVGCCAVFAALHLPRELEAAIALDRGETAAGNHDYANAISYYNKALAFYPKAPVVWGRLAVAAAHTGDKATREHALSTLADLAKDDPKSDAGRELFKATMEANGGQP